MAKIEAYEATHTSRSVRVELEVYPNVINAANIHFDGRDLIVHLPTSLTVKAWEELKRAVDEGLREYERRWPVGS